MQLSMTAAETARRVSEGELRPLETVDVFMKTAREREPNLHALLAVLEERAGHAAERLDASLSRGEGPGPLSGVPVVLDDGICVRGTPTTCASRMLEGWIAPYDSAASEMLDSSGAIICAKGNMDEFSIGCSTETSAFGATANPCDPGRVPGGSAGGCAAAVAAGYAPLALACDTGGSLLQPASYCGVYGLRPTYGLVSRWGVAALAPSMDQLGILSRTVEDAALALSVISGHDPRDAMSSPGDRPDYMAAVAVPDGKDARRPLAGRRIATVAEMRGGSDLAGACREALDRTLAMLVEAGAELVEVHLPLSFNHGLACYQVLLAAEASSSLARFDGVRHGLSAEADSLNSLYLGTRGKGFGREVKRVAAAGTYILGSDRYEDCYLRASNVRRRIVGELLDALAGCDLIALPTTPTTAFRRGEFDGDYFGMSLSLSFTVQASLAGLPALSFNAAGAGELPAGVQLIAPRRGEAGLLAAAAAIERVRASRDEAGERRSER